MMAKKASAEVVAAGMRPPNFRGAVQIIRHDIEKKKTKIQSLNGEIGDKWGTVEGYHVNKKAGKIFAALDKLEHVERVDIMRSLNGLIDAAEWDKDVEDLVDNAEGTVVHMRFGKDQGGEGGEEEDADENNEDEEIEAVAAEIEKTDGKTAAAETVGRKAGLAKDKLRGLDAARSHLGGAPAEPPYSGDNSDLAAE